MTITNLSEYRLKKAQEDDIFFPVHSITPEVIGDSGKCFDANKYKAIVNGRTGKVMAIHGSSYKLTPNSEVFPCIDEAINRSSLNTTGVQVIDELSHEGARTFRQYIFPAHETQIGEGDASVLRVIVQNSYDGSSSLAATFGAFRFVCSNGMVLGDVKARQVRKNTTNLDVNVIAANLSIGFEHYEAEIALWDKWARTHVTNKQAVEVINSMPGVNETLAEMLFLSWKDHKAEIGGTQWALYNTLTHWSTHTDIRSSSAANRASIIDQREQKVSAMLRSGPFSRLAA